MGNELVKYNKSEITVRMVKIGEKMSGNTILRSWYSHLADKNGRVNANAILVLGEIVYWYRPTITKNEKEKKLLAKAKYKADILQKSYKDLAETLCLTKDQVRKALEFLENKGLVKRELRHLHNISNVLFIHLNIDALEQITEVIDYKKKEVNKPLLLDETKNGMPSETGRGGMPLDEHGSTTQTAQVCPSSGTGMPFKADTTPIAVADVYKDYNKDYYKNIQNSNEKELMQEFLYNSGSITNINDVPLEWMDDVKKWVEAGVTKDDVVAGFKLVSILRKNKGVPYRITRPKSLEKFLTTVMSKRRDDGTEWYNKHNGEILNFLANQWSMFPTLREYEEKNREVDAEIEQLTKSDEKWMNDVIQDDKREKQSGKKE